MGFFFFTARTMIWELTQPAMMIPIDCESIRQHGRFSPFPLFVLIR